MLLNSLLRTIPVSLEQGLAYALVAIGIVISFRILAFPDLTVDGSFPLGGAVAARLITDGVSPLLAIVVAISGSGCRAGGGGRRVRVVAAGDCGC